MALTDPQTITVNSVAQPLARTGTGLLAGSFQHADSTYFLDITHQKGKRNRHLIRLTATKISEDPLTPSNNVVVSASYLQIFDLPAQGFPNADFQDIVEAVSAWMTANSGAIITKILGFES